jgi:hypothetical protein
MRSKLAISALMVAAATSLASAQTQSGPTVSSGSDATKSNRQPGITTGFATRPRTNKGVLPNPPFQNERDAGTGRGK